MEPSNINGSCGLHGVVLGFTSWSMISRVICTAAPVVTTNYGWKISVSEVPSYYDDKGDERHNSPCDGIIYNFKEGWICAKCKEDGDWPWLVASTVPTESTESASERMHTKQPDAQGAASTEAPSMQSRSEGTVPDTSGSPELQALVSAHYATLAKILSDTISKLEELQACIPNTSNKSVACCTSDAPCMFHLRWKNDALPPYYTEESDGLKPE